MSKIISPWRKDFPILSTTMHGKPLAFLDSGASAQKPRAVIEAMGGVMEAGYANIHRGLYALSQNLTASFEEVRGTVARFIGAGSEKEIIFTRNSTEAINLVAKSWGRPHLKAGDEIILTAMEHHANIVPWQLLCDQIGCVIKVVPITADGQLDLSAFEALLSKKTRLIGVVHVSNALGTHNPVEKIIQTARAYNPAIKILVDGSQSAVHMRINVRAMDADFFVFTGHKLYGPTGIGVLYGKYEILETMPPYQGGGDMIERVRFSGTTYKEPPFRFEAGTPAIVEVIGLGAAIDYVSAIGMDAIAAHEKALLEHITPVLRSVNGLRLYGPEDTAKKAGILSFTVEGAHASDLGMILDQCGVAVRTGHHCCMPLMEVLGVEATVRASFGLYTNGDDLDALIAGLEKARMLFGSGT
ncbi:MAG: cysteine desulfurase [Alphaproteobacteria bacterium]|nr:cysteine desulfurase [Alphaproteobacteria bacterium]